MREHIEKTISTSLTLSLSCMSLSVKSAGQHKQKTNKKTDKKPKLKSKQLVWNDAFLSCPKAKP